MYTIHLYMEMIELEFGDFLQYVHLKKYINLVKNNDSVGNSVSYLFDCCVCIEKL